MMKWLEALAAVAALAGCAAAEEAERPASAPAIESTAAAERQAPVFHIQLWDAHKTGWKPEALDELKAAGFTVLQNGWKGSFFPTPEFLERLRERGFLYGAYLDTRYLLKEKAPGALKERVHYSRKDEPNAFDPAYHEYVREEVAGALGRLKSTETLFKVMLNSEHGAPIADDAVTREAAARAGALGEGHAAPKYDRGVWKRGEETPEEAYAFIRWFDGEGSDGPVNRAAAEAIREAAPGVLVTTDPLMDGYAYGQYRGMDILQDWVRVHQAPRDPLSIAYRVERLKAHRRWYARHGDRRGGNAQIWIGPQLGTGTEGSRYAAPADVFEEALWLAAAFGARGVTLWGYDTVDRGDPLDADTWSRIPKFRDALTGKNAILLEAQDVPRKCAVLLSKANAVFTKRPYYEVDDNYEHFYRILLTAHVPADVVYDDDVLEGRLAQYRAVFLPGLEKLTDELEARIEEYRKGGGRVVEWPFLVVPYRDYDITKGKFEESVNVAKTLKSTLLPDQYREWRRYQAGRLFATVEDLTDIRCDNPDVVMNVLQCGSKRYVALVNDARGYGAWTKARGHRWCEDEGRDAAAVITFGGGDNLQKSRTAVGAAGLILIGFPPQSPE